MDSAKALKFSIDHIMGFAPKGNGPSQPTPDVTVPTSTHINLSGNFYHESETGCNWYPALQRLVAPTSYYQQRRHYQSTFYDYCSNGYFSHAPLNYYPADADAYYNIGRFSNATGPQSEYSEIVNPRKRSRMRTVFTENQTQKLERLFSVTDYPAAEAREELAKKAGLSAETVRVWFKNRRARRKRQIVTKGKSPKSAKRDATENSRKPYL